MLNKSLLTSASPEWYTPPELVKDIERFLGGQIDLDPCADMGLNVPALCHYVKEYGCDGLALPWQGDVYMNPPYGRTIDKWVKKALTEPVNEIVMLLPARTDTKWFWPLFDACDLCFIKGRLKFSDHKNSAPFPSVLAYKGPRSITFKCAFHLWGSVVLREQKGY